MAERDYVAELTELMAWYLMWEHVIPQAAREDYEQRLLKLSEHANAGCTCNRVGLCERCREAHKILHSWENGES